jgi:hypothetical protein
MGWVIDSTGGEFKMRLAKSCTSARRGRNKGFTPPGMRESPAWSDFIYRNTAKMDFGRPVEAECGCPPVD